MKFADMPKVQEIAKRRCLANTMLRLAGRLPKDEIVILNIRGGHDMNDGGFRMTAEELVKMIYERDEMFRKELSTLGVTEAPALGAGADETGPSEDLLGHPALGSK